MAGKVFAFLLLPPELRNKIYKSIVEDIEDVSTRLERVEPPYNAQSKSLIGLTKVCRQIRAEFRPLFYNSWDLIVTFDSLHDFLSTFGEDPSTLPRITVQIIEDDTSKHEWNILPLLRARARLPDTTWTFAEKNYLTWRTAVFLAAIFRLGKSGCLGRLPLGMFAAIKFSRTDPYRQIGNESTYEGEWDIVMYKEGGHLSTNEEKYMTSYCRALVTSMPQDKYVVHTFPSRDFIH
jgi:hypothetical protein